MKAIFDNYGRVITAVIAILAIIGIVTATMPLMQENYKSINTQMMAKVGNEDSTPSGGGNGGGSAPSQTDYGINIMQWDVSKNQDNSVVANYYVKEENQHPQKSQSAMMSLFKPMTAYAADNKTVTIDGVTYTLSDDDTIVISGSGEMMDNLQSKLCDYNKIYELTDKKFENEFAELENEGVEFCNYNKETNTFTNKHYGINSIQLVTYVKYMDLYYKIGENLNGVSGIYLYDTKTNSYSNSKHIRSDLENKILILVDSVKNYMASIKSDYSTVMPKNLIVSEGITNIGHSAFLDCNSLTNVQLPSTLRSIEPKAFAKTNIETIDIPNSVTDIGKAAFALCTNLKSINISENLTSLGDQVFQGTMSLNELDLSKTKLTTISYGLINDSNVRKVILPNKISSIGDTAFYKCKNLNNIIIPNSVKSIGKCAFMQCTSLENIVIPNGVTTIFSQTFSGCTSLHSIQLPKNLTTINEFAFINCSSLKEINLSKSVTAISEQAFYNLSEGTTIYCENQAVADLFKDGTNYKSSTTKIVVDATKFA